MLQKLYIISYLTKGRRGGYDLPWMSLEKQGFTRHLLLLLMLLVLGVVALLTLETNGQFSNTSAGVKGVVYAEGDK